MDGRGGHGDLEAIDPWRSEGATRQVMVKETSGTKLYLLGFVRERSVRRLNVSGHRISHGR